MKSLAERLRHLRAQHGLNQSQLARAANIKPQVVQLIEAGKVLQSKHLFAIANVLEVTAEFLLTGSHGEFHMRKGIPVGLEEKYPTPRGKPADHAQIPVYATNREQESNVFALHMQQIIGHVPAHPRQQNMHGGFAFYCVGNAMAPRYENGDLIYCLPNQPLRTGQDILFTLMNDNQAMMGRLVKLDRAAQKLTYEQFKTGNKHTIGLKQIVDIFVIVGRG